MKKEATKKEATKKEERKEERKEETMKKTTKKAKITAEAEKDGLTAYARKAKANKDKVQKEAESRRKQKEAEAKAKEEEMKRLEAEKERASALAFMKLLEACKTAKAEEDTAYMSLSEAQFTHGMLLTTITESEDFHKYYKSVAKLAEDLGISKPMISERITAYKVLRTYTPKYAYYTNCYLIGRYLNKYSEYGFDSLSVFADAEGVNVWECSKKTLKDLINAHVEAMTPTDEAEAKEAEAKEAEAKEKEAIAEAIKNGMVRMYDYEGNIYEFPATLVAQYMVQEAK